MWVHYTNQLCTPGTIRGPLRRLRSAIGRSFRLVIEKPTQPLGQFLPGELLRIYAESLRRMYQAAHAADVRAASSLYDTTRALFELHLQAFYLLRCNDPEQAARDAS